MPGAVMADIEHKLETHVKDDLQFKLVQIVDREMMLQVPQIISTRWSQQLL